MALLIRIVTSRSLYGRPDCLADHFNHLFIVSMFSRHFSGPHASIFATRFLHLPQFGFQTNQLISFASSVPGPCRLEDGDATIATISDEVPIVSISDAGAIAIILDEAQFSSTESVAPLNVQLLSSAVVSAPCTVTEQQSFPVSVA